MKTQPCGKPCEVYSRVCGYFRPVANWNRGKKEEFRQRKTYRIPAQTQNKPSKPLHFKNRYIL